LATLRVLLGFSPEDDRARFPFRGGLIMRPAALAGTTALIFVGLFGLHVQLNHGGFARQWRRMNGGKQARGELTVGFLPVTCHLTCPVTHWVTSHSTHGSVFRSKKYTEFATIAEELKEGQLKASFLLAPLAMTLRRQGLPIKIVHLGHRDGTTLIVGKDSPARNVSDLRGKTIAIPHMYSNQRILLAREMDKYGMKAEDLSMVVYPPPEMPSALQRGAIDAYIVGEPMAAKAEVEGFGRVLAFTKDLWPGFISCVLVVHEDLIRNDRKLVEELVSGISRSGQWLDAPGDDLAPGVVREGEGAPGDGIALLPRAWDSGHRSQAAVIASRNEYYGQKQDLVRFVLSKPPDRVRYTELVPARADFEEIQRYAEKLGYFAPSTKDAPFGFDDYCDPSFAMAGK
jgi:NitT/TauT family transport system substrate-binding protein